MKVRSLTLQRFALAAGLCAGFLTYSISLFAGPSGSGHVHSVSMGDGSSGSSFNSGSGGPPPSVNLGAQQPAPPPPPPPPPPVFAPKVISKSGWGVESQVKSLGAPRDNGSRASGVRSISGIYEDESGTVEEPVERRTPLPAIPSSNNSPSNF